MSTFTEVKEVLLALAYNKKITVYIAPFLAELQTASRI